MALEKLLQDVLALPREDRARLANALQESLGLDGEQPPGEAEWEAAWATEIERRLGDFDEGRTTAISYEEFKSRMRARLPQR
ncbi:MAG TPA: addiction module protein [Kofleriaceae bacterium]